MTDRMMRNKPDLEALNSWVFSNDFDAESSCILCGKIHPRAEAVFISSEGEHVCPPCAFKLSGRSAKVRIEQARKEAVTYSSLPEKGSYALPKLIDIEQDTPFLLLGMLEHIGKFMDAAAAAGIAAGRSGVRTRDLMFKVAEPLFYLLGYHSDHQLSKLVRTYAFQQILRYETKTLTNLRRFSEEFEKQYELITFPSQIRFDRILYNTAKLCGIMLPYRDYSQKLIISAISLAGTQNAGFVKEWFFRSRGYYEHKPFNRDTYKKLDELTLLIPLKSPVYAAAERVQAKEQSQKRSTRITGDYRENSLRQQIPESQIGNYRNALASMIENLYTLPQLKQFWSQSLKKIAQKHPRLLETTYSLVPEAAVNTKKRATPLVARIKSPVLKKQFSVLWSLIIMDPELLFEWFNTQPRWVRAFVEQIVWYRKLIPQEQIVEHADTAKLPQWSDNPLYALNYRYGTEELSLFYVGTTLLNNRGYGSWLPIVGSLAMSLMHEFYNKLPIPAACLEIKPLTLPEGSCMNDCSSSVEQAIPIYLFHYGQLGIKRIKNGDRIMKTSLRRYQKLFALDEPYPHIPDLEYLRTNLLLEMIDSFSTVKLKNKAHEHLFPQSADPVNSIIKKLFFAYFSPDFPAAKKIDYFFFDQLKHISSSYPYRIPSTLLFTQKERQAFLEIVRQLEVESWAEVENLAAMWIRKRADYHSLEAGNNDHFLKELSIDHFEEGKYRVEKNRLYLNDLNVCTIQFYPHLKLLLFALNTLGAVKLEIEEPKREIFRDKRKAWLSPYDGIRMVSLTPLGAWLLGKGDEPQGAAARGLSPTIRLDEKRLLIYTERETPVLEMALREFGETVGKGWWLMKPEKIVSGCTAVRQIEERVNLFRSQVLRYRENLQEDARLPQNWEQFLTALIDQAAGLSAEKTFYRTFRVAAHDAELANLLFSDKELAGCVVKGEGYRIFIPEQLVEKVRKRLALFGRILPE